MQEYDYDLAVFIGRFQIAHKSHIEVIKQGLSIAKKVAILVGSYRTAPSIKNPFSFEERVEMLRSSLSEEENARVECVPIRDFLYNDSIWVTNVQLEVSKLHRPGASVALIGNYKDDSSYYLNYFKTTWDFVPVSVSSSLNATDIRESYFGETSSDWRENIPETTVGFLQKFQQKQAARYTAIREELVNMKKYKEKWSSAPFPPTFITADAVVTCSGHVLLVTRKFAPGKGLWALPGGFVKQNEFPRDASARELKEETGIRLQGPLQRFIQKDRVFDHPKRSLRGRTITFAYHYRLPDGEIPEIRAGDDADTAFWVPFSEVAIHEDRFFEDHAQIISHFLYTSLT